MRYDTPVYFQRVVPGAYDPDTGNYGNDTVEEVKRYASVVGTSVEVLKVVYGELKQGSRTIHLQTHYDKPYDRIRIGRKIYGVDYDRPLRAKHVFVVSEVQQNGNKDCRNGEITGKA